MASEGIEVSSSAVTWNLPTFVMREIIDFPKLGTEANPIVVSDDAGPLGSASNPIIINFDNDCGHHVPWEYHSDGDTEVVATPDFLENLIDGSFPNLPNEEAVMDRFFHCSKGLKGATTTSTYVAIDLALGTKAGPRSVVEM
ncbi:hypothetical protein PENARI_c040G09683 [Penicillium arizonense]|uniref:Uncharacterized protein n=1 Tax=Penicillium arizonense TaxID=1835702 RepID=A0A1F5L2Z8_PENAI|nr:hypothetical protein PENARI_c040G09683 [Penicillium arizonense]OGE47593.1 hypothetical protein PENARI_c040G09683 [Penicillium arizonense]